MVYYCYYASPIGKILLSADDNHLLSLGLPIANSIKQPAAHWIERPNKFTNICQQLMQYFNGKLQQFSISFAVSCSSFVTSVLLEVQQIPFGSTKSYKDIAVNINNPQAARAVGMANAKNPLPIIIPCHRVVGKNNSLVGFGGTRDTTIKEFLLNLEKRYG